ncbi:MAG: hypothetical protein FJ314_00995 [SAR202 cluster bacterium]|nr:hypothetical protein [SAR202 cluster bacterium]
MNGRVLNETWSVGRIDELLAGIRTEEGTYCPESSVLADDWEWLPGSARTSRTGVYLISGPAMQLAIVPPFAPAPPYTDWKADLRRTLSEPRRIGVVLLRLGYFAVGVVNNGAVEVARGGSRYVHGRHRAGGQSQRRWERNRDQWIEALFDRACSAWQESCGPLAGRLDHLALGGDRIVLGRFLVHCPALARLRDREIARRVPVDRPRSDAIEQARRAIWSSVVHRISA